MSAQHREQELRESTRRLHLALEAIETRRLETDEVVWNETLEQLLGIEPGTFEGTYDDSRKTSILTTLPT